LRSGLVKRPEHDYAVRLLAIKILALAGPNGICADSAGAGGLEVFQLGHSPIVRSSPFDDVRPLVSI
jgi:hypothetical protein